MSEQIKSNQISLFTTLLASILHGTRYLSSGGDVQKYILLIKKEIEKRLLGFKSLNQ